MKNLVILIALFFVFYFFIVSEARAFDSSSTNFKVKAAGIESISGESGSTSFKNQGAGGQIATGISSNINKIYSGILYWLFPSVTGAVCGNSTIETGEECDDGNTANGDGCSSTCLNEAPLVCGDGTCNGSETCHSCPTDCGACTGGGLTTPSVVIPPIPPLPTPPAEYAKADLNRDGKVGLSDLSIFIYFMSRPIPNLADLNKDSKVGLKDFSILISQWNEGAPVFALEQPEAITELRKMGEKEWIRTQQAAAWTVSPEEKGPTLIPQERARGMGAKLLKSFTLFISNVYKKVQGFFIKKLKK